MIPSLSVSTTSRRVSADDAIQNLSACDVISIRFRRRGRSCRINKKHNGRGTSTCPNPKPLMLLFVAIAVFFFANKVAPVHSLSAAKNQWINNSLHYYNRVTRGSEHVQESPTYLKSAMENYFALEKIRDNKSHQAETIYRRLMEELDPRNSGNNEKASLHAADSVEHCDLSNLAVPTLLLGLLLQREHRVEDARTVFEGFSHVLNEQDSEHRCCCAARVLQAHALFEMKHDNPVRAAELITRAVRMDRNLRPVLRWKQFRVALAEYRKFQAVQRRGRREPRAVLAAQ
eukprot:CAMPEP_0201232910 /NCGR_PEP_ID=MMETSP0852-20130820/4751_1 /ASSEMBLY_ACC=CAM_ASM_000632 /TAXON_ID=183588 /ORGANISM="Pseudo-nitzschia fraudulenta, Strain WWA7" /LENGTH=287 /DNA_ID=CAMNT_0047525541 /DNA_START=65 /DNA_END=928 /DNA_ORIENTATION=+